MKYLARKLLKSLMVLFIVSIVIFLAVHASGDPLQNLLDPSAGPDIRELMKQKLGLDKPLAAQYGIFIRDALKGDFGTSYTSGRPVIEVIGEKLPRTLLLAALALALALIFTIILGTAAALKRDRLLDKGVKIFSALGQSFPVFFLAIIAVQLLSVKARLLPVSGSGTVLHYVLPCTLLGLCISSSMVLVLRNNMLEVLSGDYIRFARLRGISEFRVVFRHALRNAFSTILSLSTFIFASLITGSIVIESVFAFPGIGNLSYEAILSRNFPLVQGIVIVLAVIIVTLSFLTDLLHGVLDPRIRLQGEDGNG